MYVKHIHTWYLWGGQKNPLEMELQTVVSHRVNAGNQIWVLCKRTASSIPVYSPSHLFLTSSSASPSLLPSPSFISPFSFLLLKLFFLNFPEGLRVWITEVRSKDLFCFLPQQRPSIGHCVSSAYMEERKDAEREVEWSYLKISVTHPTNITVLWTIV